MQNLCTFTVCIVRSTCTELWPRIQGQLAPEVH